MLCMPTGMYVIAPLVVILTSTPSPHRSAHIPDFMWGLSNGYRCI